MRHVLAAVLRAYGFLNIKEAADGEDAMRQLSSFQPDVIVTDFAMPRLDGIALTRRVRAEANGTLQYVPIIMVSGHAHYNHVLAARDAGVNEFLAKPVT